MKTYPNASTEPLETIRQNECDADPGLATRRFQALWNEIERLRTVIVAYSEAMMARTPVALTPTEPASVAVVSAPNPASMAFDEKGFPKAAPSAIPTSTFIPTATPYFGAVVEKLRKLCQTQGIGRVHPNSSYVAQLAMKTAEAEAAAQAVIYLYEHNVYHEQWREAAHLLAYALPHLVADDPRVLEKARHALAIGETVSSPAAEMKSFATHIAQVVPTETLLDARYAPPRALYWYEVCAISRAKVALEYGTGSGSNVIQFAVADDIRWIGVDISEEQIVINRKAVEENKVSNASFYLEPIPPASTEGWSLPFHTADVVAVLDTLEHTVYPMELLERAESYVRRGDGVRPNGLVVVTTPNGGWSPFTPNETYVGPGQHVSVERLTTLKARLAERGRIIDARILPGTSIAEGNSTVAITYEPHFGEKKICTCGVESQESAICEVHS